MRHALPFVASGGVTIAAVDSPELQGFRERRVASLFREVLGVDVTGAHDDFFALGGDAPSAARLLELVAEDAGVQLPANAIDECRTVRQLARRIAETPPTRRARVVGFGTELDGPPLFCLMSAFQARALARSFNAEAGRPFVVVQPAGLEGRALVDRGFERRARRAVADIRRVQPRGPYFVAGYSYNAWVAFEVARRLQDLGELVQLLAILDIWAPVYGRVQIARLRLQTRWLTVARWNPERGRCFDARRRALLVRETVRDCWTNFTWRVRSWTAGIVPRGSSEQGMLFFRLAEIDTSRYHPRPVDVDMTLVKARDFGGWDWLVRRAQPDMSWHHLVNGRVDVVSVSGDHITILEDDGAAELARVLAAAMNRRQ